MFILTHFASTGHNVFPSTNPHRKLCQSGVKKDAPLLSHYSIPQKNIAILNSFFYSSLNDSYFIYIYSKGSIIIFVFIIF